MNVMTPETKLPNLENKNIKLAVIYALLASLCNALMSIFVKLIGEGQSTVEVIFFRFFIGLLILLPWLLTEKNLFSTPYLSKLFLRSITTLLAMACVFYSLKYLPVANVVLLNNTFPLFIPFLVLIMFKIKTSLKLWISVIIGFIGVAFVFHAHLNTLLNGAVFIALASGLLSALAILQIRLLSDHVSPKQVLFYMLFFCTIMTAIILPFDFKMPTSHELILLVMVGLFGAGYQLFITLALYYALARIVSPLFFSAVLFAVILDWLIWGIIPTFGSFVGMLLVIFGGIMTIVLRDKKQ